VIVLDNLELPQNSRSLKIEKILEFSQFSFFPIENYSGTGIVDAPTKLGAVVSVWKAFIWDHDLGVNSINHIEILNSIRKRDCVIKHVGIMQSKICAIKSW